jgi:uncharacterized low-complexity protein
MIDSFVLPRMGFSRPMQRLTAEFRFKELVMKSVFIAMAVATALMVPAASFAQSTAPAKGVQSQVALSSGGVADGTSASGSAGHERFGARAADFFHRGNARNSQQRNQCVGPVSYCTIFFGS